MADSPRSSPRRLRKRKALPKDPVSDEVQENDANDKAESEGNQKLYPNLTGLQEKSPNDAEVEDENQLDNDVDGTDDAEKVKLYPNLTGLQGKSPNDAEVEDENQSDNDVDGTDDAEIVKENRIPKEDENVSEIGVVPVIATLFAMLAILLYIFCPIRGDDQICPEVRAFKDSLAVLKSKFPSQSELIWEAVAKLGGDHLNEVYNETLEGPNRPLVFVFTSISRNKKTLNCLARKIGETFQADNTQIGNVVSGNEIATSSNQKQALDERLRSILDESDNHRVVIVTEIDSLSYEVASIFFKYCDNEGAPYPRAVFIFTLTMDKEDDFLQQSRKEITRETREYLSEVVLKDGDKAQIDALIARIMDPFPFKVMNEKHDVCSDS
ncbi:torsin-1A-interacting protein 2-like isoform X2 [Rhopilema esculentum]|uniref:torsin-1A-interacting protein 2-like isoform X2 n=1 Tax=Rhopilema esculentum TaxID=499914 RepID=UPI0031DA448F